MSSESRGCWVGLRCWWGLLESIRFCTVLHSFAHFRGLRSGMGVGFLYFYFIVELECQRKWLFMTVSVDFVGEVIVVIEMVVQADGVVPV